MIFHIEEGHENDEYHDNISINVGTNRYSVEEHTAFRDAIVQQLCWNTAMRSQERIIDCYIPGNDIDLKAKYNKELEACFKGLDELFDTSWMSKRKWYTVRELIELGKTGITDDELVKWFQTDIPAFGYVSFVDMSRLENGEHIVRYFLTSVPLGFP